MDLKYAVKKIVVLGNGSWGTTLAILLYKKGYEVTLWGANASYVDCLKEKRENIKFLKGVPIPSGISLTSDISPVLKDNHLVVSATPTPYLRAVLTKFLNIFSHEIPMVSVTKGIENDTLMTPSEIITDVLGKRPVSLLLGPSHAEEVVRGLPTTVVASSKDDTLARIVQGVFTTDRFRVYTNPDVIGVELGAAMKNVIAIAAGICDGLKFGDNSKAALISRGLAEISRLGIAMGAQKSTFSGLTGLGDLITTCISPYGRNRRVGEQIGKGKKLQEILDAMEQIAEGVWTTKSVMALSRKFSVEMPITKEIYAVLFLNKNPLEAVSHLMMRAPRSEMEDLI
ncbi:MAG: NAD(P)-dependent glycerol-3-phosphate dehydrogenase [Planctomycetia bacterium]|jgi:glycerol-3-phosphate dehydrogenase (NAD(P)+)|uniref:Glycerol-3-phosphate dehydrogenase [NAD(P)+] n=1 Tax=Candidatus Brocadia sapporoensis TaxID=392547 RepID=A0A1V6M038_9BACT|nr:NAD(P)-dependent glycerol-3-phosphate dehydrogenase [Candidatus Brocadia sapporoensis]MCC7238374.1 NAD(P)-dependent glycerol-3-phosphate dehydrogenase [Candidatus Brocadia sp.]OQZ01213.1 MAG: glycerol-3-phosphate dehydrogenase [Candidatus Brocadia sp. UTAMX1]QOJ05328.1 MAG: NAD(P)-dependent glycerol-3-phosphate dehydrogenase [Planctomycetia bacterium]RZV56550.1 MAG: NAD(P)-dependent glycerol-3-phosphate dehydrogenase [Candidatus Brocadia sp. BROELEC01]TVL97592.1 MAG: NAD(P)-dependent glycer